MVRSSQATTFSSSPYFFDRGFHGTAEPITERVNVGSMFGVSFLVCLTESKKIAALSSHRRVLLPQGHRFSSLRSKRGRADVFMYKLLMGGIGTSPNETSQIDIDECIGYGVRTR
jgi:hypothetical protein